MPYRPSYMKTCRTGCPVRRRSRNHLPPRCNSPARFGRPVDNCSNNILNHTTALVPGKRKTSAWPESSKVEVNTWQSGIRQAGRSRQRQTGRHGKSANCWKSLCHNPIEAMVRMPKDPKASLELGGRMNAEPAQYLIRNAKPLKSPANRSRVLSCRPRLWLSLCRRPRLRNDGLLLS